MCGIVGYIGDKDISTVLLVGLERLSYRGYDSAGIACINSKDKLVVTKRKGKVSELKSALSNSEIYNLGIAHTRWATHGKPNQLNAHPHLDQSKKIALVHNGIIENYDPIKKFLLSKKIKFKSETDTEVLVQLIGYFYNNGKMNFEQSVRAALQRVDGAYGIVILNTDYPDMMIAARKGSPLVLGIKENEFFIASDISPIVKHTKDIIYLKDSEMAVVSKKSFKIKSVDKDISLPKNIEKIDFISLNYQLFLIQSSPYYQPQYYAITPRGCVTQCSSPRCNWPWPPYCSPSRRRCQPNPCTRNSTLGARRDPRSPPPSRT